MDLYNILMDNDVVSSINNNLDSLLYFIPEINSMIGFMHKHPDHHLDVWNHTLNTLKLSEQDYEIRLVLLLHDIGKPYSFTEGEVRHFHNHAKMSYLISSKILERLNFEDNFKKEILYLIKHHDLPILDSEIMNNYELAQILYKIQVCDIYSHNPKKLEKRIKYLEKTKSKF